MKANELLKTASVTAAVARTPAVTTTTLLAESTIDADDHHSEMMMIIRSETDVAYEYSNVRTCAHALAHAKKLECDVKMVYYCFRKSALFWRNGFHVLISYFEIKLHIRVLYV